MEVRDNGMPISLLITWSSYFSPNHYLQNQKRYWFEIATKVVNGLQVNGGGCSTASLPKVWYFAILMMFWKILLDMCIFPITYIIIKKNRHAWLITEDPKLRCYPLPPPPPIERGSGPYELAFLVQPVPLIKNTWNLVSVKR